MTHEEDQLRRRLAEFNFPGEPVDAGRAEDDLVRARSAHRRRTAAWTTATAGIVALGAGIAFAVPNFDSGAELFAAGEPNVMDEAGCGGGAPADEHLGFAGTRQCLLDVAAKHFDPERIHLPEVLGSAGTGSGEHGWRVSSKLEWQVPGESGLGMIEVAVTTPGYAEGDYAERDMASVIGCEEIADCEYQTVPGTEQQVFVAEADPARNLLLGVMYQRPDGSFTGVGVYDLFGNNSLEPVSNVDITLEQAMAFVMDPALQVDQSEIAEAEKVLAEELAAAESGQAPDEADFSSPEVIPAPAVHDMTVAEMRAAFEECIEGADDSRSFEPVLGISIETDSDLPMYMLIAERGSTKMLCDYTSAMLFGTAGVKGTPYLRGEVSSENPYFGRYTSNIDRITVQFSGEPQREAVMKDGYWYVPYEEAISGTDVMPSPAALRGYDASGELVYDSTTVDPEACYANPEGTEIVHHGTDEDSDVKDCIRMLEWDF
ncbi:MAG TPA: hypothetical protein VFZ63_09855 [Jiangellaceae bacterium]